MSRAQFTREEFASRLALTRLEMHKANLDWMLLFHPVSIFWLTGSEAKSFQAFQCLVVSADDDKLRMFTRESERAEFQDDALVDVLHSWGRPGAEDPLGEFDRWIDGLGLKASRVGMEVPAFYLSPYQFVGVRQILGSALVVESNTLVHDLKMVKSPAEIAYIRKAAEIGDATVEVLRGALGAGRSETEIAGELYRCMLSRGGSIPPTAMNLTSGERAAFSHGAPTERVLRAGDTGNAEYCVSYRRYSVSIGRQFVLGRPSKRLQEIYAVVREAGDAAIDAIRHGVPARIPFERAQAIIASAGLDQHRIHIAGYGLAPGFPPAAGDQLGLTPSSTYALKAGMHLSICPPVFIADERIGVRLVDNVLVTEGGAERLSQTSRDLIVVE